MIIGWVWVDLPLAFIKHCVVSKDPSSREEVRLLLEYGSI